MKFRLGFVSNSSSGSFLPFLDYDVSLSKWIRDKLFGKTKKSTLTPVIDPKVIQINDAIRIGNFTIVDVIYEEYINFDGRKILVFKDFDYLKLFDEHLDPHFLEDNNLVARFVPTDEGVKMAIQMCNSYYSGV